MAALTGSSSSVSDPRASRLADCRRYRLVLTEGPAPEAANCSCAGAPIREPRRKPDRTPAIICYWTIYDQRSSLTSESPRLTNHQLGIQLGKIWHIFLRSSGFPSNSRTPSACPSWSLHCALPPLRPRTRRTARQDRCYHCGEMLAKVIAMRQPASLARTHTANSGRVREEFVRRFET